MFSKISPLFLRDAQYIPQNWSMCGKLYVYFTDCEICRNISRKTWVGSKDRLRTRKQTAGSRKTSDSGRVEGSSCYPRSRFPSLFSPFRIPVPPGTLRRTIPSRPRFNAQERRDGSKDDRTPPPPPPPPPLFAVASVALPWSRTDRKTRELSRSVPQWADVRRMSYDRTKVATHHARSRRTMLRRLI